MRHSSLCVLVVTFVATACAARTNAPAYDVTAWRGDARLYHILTTHPLTAAEHDSLAVYAREHEPGMNVRLGEAAIDPQAPPVVRANALSILARRRAVDQLYIFRAALDDPDTRVRATAAAGMREFIHTHPREALRLARMALGDPEPEVQAQALQIIGDTDVELMRSYLRTVEHEELRQVARDLVRLAEARGAPLRGDTASGVLRRETPAGHVLTFTPVRRWPAWEAAEGTVRIERAGAEPLMLDGIEVVAGVVPVFFSPDGAHLVYERNRRIAVRDMNSGAERDVGAGIAPRVVPFTDTFVYLRETPDSRTPQRQQTRIRYEVVRASFTDDLAPHTLGTTTASASFGVHGNYSPVRWMRVEERGGSFYLSGDEMEIFALPDPFGAAERD